MLIVVSRYVAFLSDVIIFFLTNTSFSVRKVTTCVFLEGLDINPLRPNSDLSQTSHCNIKGLSVSEVKRIENMITQVKFY